MLRAKLKDSVDILCNSGGQPLALCLWERTGTDDHLAIVIDHDVVRKGSQTPLLDGITLAGTALTPGKCGLKILSMSTEHFGARNSL